MCCSCSVQIHKFLQTKPRLHVTRWTSSAGPGRPALRRSCRTAASTATATSESRLNKVDDLTFAHAVSWPDALLEVVQLCRDDDDCPTSLQIFSSSVAGEVHLLIPHMLPLSHTRTDARICDSYLHMHLSQSIHIY